MTSLIIALIIAVPIVPILARKLVLKARIRRQLSILGFGPIEKSLISPPIRHVQRLTRSRGETIELKVKSLASEDIAFIASMLGFGIREDS